MSEPLYNGITLPQTWPPRTIDLNNSAPVTVPYLQNPPAVIDIDIGRQLFVDDFLVDTSVSGWAGSMTRIYPKPVKYPGNPVFFPQTADEYNDELPPCAIAKSGGVWFDATDQTFKMWYMSSYLGYASYATSKDGVHWERPQLDVVLGTNHILPREVHPDSGSVVIDYAAPAAERYKMLLREPNPPETAKIPAWLYTSADGIHWNNRGQTGPMDDRSTMFYNPFRKVWVQSIRRGNGHAGRLRYYMENVDFVQSGVWGEDDATTFPWLRADCLDEGGGNYPQLYNLDAIPYESVILSFPQILKGPPNHVGEALGLPKLTELTAAYSRDGFHWHRPDRTPFLGARREPGSWEYGYVESSAGMCLVIGDELWFYYSAYAGDPTRTSSNKPTWYVNGTYANGAVGLAKLRRDGFAAMCARFPGAQLGTRPLRFSGDRLFVNVNTAGTYLRAEVLGENAEVLPSYGREDSVPFLGNSTCVELRWKSASLGALSGKPVRFRFMMDRGELYSFWVTKNQAGASNGYVAAGGPGFTGHTDTIGQCDAK